MRIERCAKRPKKELFSFISNNERSKHEEEEEEDADNTKYTQSIVKEQ
jgi:hypothetical protein